MNREDFMHAAKAYAGLGWAVQEQFDTLCDIADGAYTLDEAYDDGKLNSNAVRMIRSYIRDNHDGEEEWADVLAVIADYDGEVTS